MTLRQTLQSKIDAAKASVTALEAELTQAESTYADWIDAEYEAFKAKAEAFAALVTSHL